MKFPSCCVLGNRAARAAATEHGIRRAGHRSFFGAALLLPALVFLALAGRPAHSTSVFRCSDGYADRPCPGAVLLDNLDDRRSDSQRAAATEVAAREAALAARMTRDRERSSKLAATSGGGAKTSKRRLPSSGPGATSLASSANATHNPGKARRQGTDSDDFVAYVPKPSKQSATIKPR